MLMPIKKRQSKSNDLAAKRQRASIALARFNAQAPATAEELSGRFTAESPQETWNRLKAEEKEENQRRERGAQKEFNDRTGLSAVQEEARDLNRTIAAVWSQPLDKLQRLFEHDVKVLSDAFANLPTRETEITPANHAQIQKVAESLPEILPSLGIYLNDIGYQRLLLFVAAQAQADNGGFLAVDSSSVWVAAVNRLQTLNAFADGEIQIAREPEPAKQKLTEIEQIEAEHNHLMTAAYHAWTGDLKSRFNVTLTDDLLRWCCDKLVTLNLSPYSIDSWHEVRRAANKAGILNAADTDDILTEMIENGEISTPAQFHREAQRRNFGR